MRLSWLKPGGKGLWIALAVAAAVLMLSAALGGGSSTGASPEELRIAEVLSAMAGAGRVEVALYYEHQQPSGLGGDGQGKPVGAVVVAQGAHDLGVRLSLIRAVRTLLSLPEAAVDVFVMEDGR